MFEFAGWLVSKDEWSCWRGQVVVLTEASNRVDVVVGQVGRPKRLWAVMRRSMWVGNGVRIREYFIAHAHEMFYFSFFTKSGLYY